MVSTNRALCCFILVAVFCLGFCTAPARAGISSVNVLVAANRNDKESLRIALYYMQARQIPRSNFILLDIPEKLTINEEVCLSRDDIDYRNYVEMIEQPIKSKLEEPGLKGRIHAIVFTKGIPFRIRQKKRAPWRSGLTMSLIVGEEKDPPLNPTYARDTGYCYSHELPSQPTPMLFYLAGWDYTDITAMIDRSVGADSTFPKGTFYLLEGDGARSARKEQIPGVVRIAQRKGIPVKSQPGSKLFDKNDILGYFTGCTYVRFKGNRLLPGAIGDHLTSYGGKLYDQESGQMSVLDYIHNGASMTYGTVFEPTSIPSRHMGLSCVVYYGSGFTAGEAYAFNIMDLLYAVLVGDPMTAPFAHLPELEEKEPGKYLVKATAPDARILRVELWQNGKFVRNVFEPHYEESMAFFIGDPSQAMAFSFQSGESLQIFLKRIAVELHKALPMEYTVLASPSHLTFIPVEKNHVNQNLSKVGMAPDGPVLNISNNASKTMQLDSGAFQWKFYERGNATAEVTLEEEDLTSKDVYLNVICANQAYTSKAFPLAWPATATK
ncbi:MAG: TIGR03790 family protein [Planctomycetes bacterium]|nr:TIGR03790 family protein [Planctomycetota bacterium]